VPVARSLSARPGSADVAIGPGPSGRLVVLAEPANGGWYATINGQDLTARTAYGWAQAFTVPEAGGALHVGYHSRSRDLWLTGELVVILVLVAVMLPPRRAEDEELAS
jgi:hypothetical protein